MRARSARMRAEMTTWMRARMRAEVTTWMRARMRAEMTTWMRAEMTTWMRARMPTSYQLTVQDRGMMPWGRGRIMEDTAHIIDTHICGSKAEQRDRSNLGTPPDESVMDSQRNSDGIPGTPLARRGAWHVNLCRQQGSAAKEPTAEWILRPGQGIPGQGNAKSRFHPVESGRCPAKLGRRFLGL
eukprot:gene1241-biopygen929